MKNSLMTGISLSRHSLNLDFTIVLATVFKHLWIITWYKSNKLWIRLLWENEVNIQILLQIWFSLLFFTFLKYHNIQKVKYDKQYVE